MSNPRWLKRGRYKRASFAWGAVGRSCAAVSQWARHRVPASRPGARRVGPGGAPYASVGARAHELPSRPFGEGGSEGSCRGPGLRRAVVAALRRGCPQPRCAVKASFLHSFPAYPKAGVSRPLSGVLGRLAWVRCWRVRCILWDRLGQVFWHPSWVFKVLIRSHQSFCAKWESVGIFHKESIS